MTFQSLGRSITRHLGLFACGSIISGVVIGNNFRPESLRLLIPVALFMMLYPMMLDIKLGDMGETLRKKGKRGTLVLKQLIFPGGSAFPAKETAFLHAPQSPFQRAVEKC